MRAAWSFHWAEAVETITPMLEADGTCLTPEQFLGAFGWPCVDPIASRLVAAALAGIGIQSLLGRHEGAEVFRAMLTLKIIWSAFATLGILASQLDGGPPMGWMFFAIFGSFFAIWTRYRLSLSPRRV